jgi:hypothetical protein
MTTFLLLFAAFCFYMSWYKSKERRLKREAGKPVMSPSASILKDIFLIFVIIFLVAVFAVAVGVLANMPH